MLMNQKDFLNGIGNSQKDIIQEIIDLLNRHCIDYCVIGGLAVNAYVEPVVSLDLDIVVIISGVDKLLQLVEGQYQIEKFPHSINLKSKYSDIRIQVQTDERYQDFIQRASINDMMGYKIKVASLDDVFIGKVWAYSDERRRGSKRQKDLADMMRMIESYPELKLKLPDSIRQIIDQHA